MKNRCNGCSIFFEKDEAKVFLEGKYYCETCGERRKRGIHVKGGLFKNHQIKGLPELYEQEPQQEYLNASELIAYLMTDPV